MTDQKARMNRRDFFMWFRKAPLAVPVLVASGLSSDGVQLDGQSLYLAGRKVMDQRPDGTLMLGEHGDIKLFGEKAVMEFMTVTDYPKPQERPLINGPCQVLT